MPKCVCVCVGHMLQDAEGDDTHLDTPRLSRQPPCLCRNSAAACCAMRIMLSSCHSTCTGLRQAHFAESPHLTTMHYVTMFGDEVS